VWSYLGPASSILNTQKDFAALWTAWSLGDLIPHIDFDSCFVVVVTKQKQSADLVGLFLKADGDCEVGVLSDAQNKNRGFGFAIGVFPREKIKKVHGRLVRKD